MTNGESNFEFLENIGSELFSLGRLAESYFGEDPSTCLIKIRQIAERLTKRHAALAGVEILSGDTQSDLLRKLKYECSASDTILDVLHHIRKLGNSAFGGQGQAAASKVANEIARLMKVL